MWLDLVSRVEQHPVLLLCQESGQVPLRRSLWTPGGSLQQFRRFSSILLISQHSVLISGYFLLAVALGGKRGMDTELASPLLTGEKDICFNFWFEISQSAYEIEEVDIYIESSRDLTRIKVWQLNPTNLGESWQQGRLQLAGLAHEEYKVRIKFTLGNN